MAAAEYKSLVADMDLPDLLNEAEFVRDATGTHGWKLVQASVDTWRDKSLQRLTNPSTKPEDVRFLQGLVAGLNSMREAADTILSLASEREAEARQETHV
jgi:hypothetical protein